MTRCDTEKARCRRLAPLWLGVLALGCGSTSGDIITTAWTTQTARPSDEFVDSVGIDVRLARRDSAYFDAFDDIVIPALDTLRVRHVRDEIGAAYRDDSLGPVLAARFGALSERGRRLLFLADPRLDIEPHEVGAIHEWSRGAIEAFEAPTDHNAGRDANSQEIEEYTRQLVERVQRLDGAARVAVVAPGCDHEGCARPPEDIDYGNALLEVGTDSPGRSLPSAFLKADEASSSRPLVATGIGYRSGSRDDRPGVSDIVMAKYVTRALLLAFEMDAVRTYVRHLVDFGDKDEVDAHSGLLTAEGREKTAFIALSNLLSVLEDKGQTRFSGSLELRLTGDMTDVHHVLLKRRDGRFYLILWLEVSGWNSTKDREIAVAARRVRLELRHVMEMRRFTPVESPNGTPVITGNSFDLDVPDHPLVVELEPL